MTALNNLSKAQTNLSRRLRACVFCGSRKGNDPCWAALAQEVGQELAAHHCDLVFGGGNTGLMGIVSQSALQAGSHVTGVIPEFLTDREPPADNLSELIVVSGMQERKHKMEELADFFVVLPGGIGTYEEVFEVVTNNWLDLFHKPVGFLNARGYYNTMFAFLEEAMAAGFLAPEAYALFNRQESARELIDALVTKTTGAVKA